MTKRSLALLIPVLFAAGCTASSASAQERRTQFLNKASNDCIRVEQPPAGAIIAGELRTFFCGRTPEGLIDMGNGAPAQLRFHIAGREQCIKVRRIDMERFPSPIFTHDCSFPISGWSIGGTTDGFGEVRLFTDADDLCLGVDTLRRTVVIDKCSGKPDQKWKLVSINTREGRIDGRTAVGVCVDSNASGARCAWSVNDKGEIDICNKSGCVYCPSATGECTAAKGRPKPARTLPVGATVKTPVVSVQITGKPHTGSILSFSCPQGMHSCPGAGCRPSTETCILPE
jgi:hypothetical protein